MTGPLALTTNKKNRKSNLLQTALGPSGETTLPKEMMLMRDLLTLQMETKNHLAGLPLLGVLQWSPQRHMIRRRMKRLKKMVKMTKKRNNHHGHKVLDNKKRRKKKQFKMINKEIKWLLTITKNMKNFFLRQARFNRNNKSKKRKRFKMKIKFKKWQLRQT